MNNQYEYGYTAEASKLVRETLKAELGGWIQRHDLKIRVRKADSGYGGPRVKITSPRVYFDNYYSYIVDENGNPSDSGKSTVKPCRECPNGRPDYRATLCTSDVKQAMDDRVREVLQQFGHDNDDAMTDYFDNTAPLFYGIKYEA